MATRKGIPNKFTATAKENILAVFTRIGGTAEMAVWARENRTEFYKLYARLVPVDLRVSGELNYTAKPIPVEQREQRPSEKQLIELASGTDALPSTH